MDIMINRKREGRLLPLRPKEKVRNKIGGGRNECVLHTTKRQKSRAMIGVMVWFSYFISFFSEHNLN